MSAKPQNMTTGNEESTYCLDCCLRLAQFRISATVKPDCAIRTLLLFDLPCLNGHISDMNALQVSN